MAAVKLSLAIGLYAACALTRLATAQYGPTCDALDSAVASVQLMECTRNDQCDTVNCTITQEPFDGTPLTLTILPCRDPPGVHVVVRDRDSGTEILNRVIDHTVTGIDLGSGATLDVTLDQLDGAIGMEAAVNIRIFIFTQRVVLLPYTTVPLNNASCTSVTPTTQTLTTTIQETTETPSPITQEITTTPTTREITTMQTTQEIIVTPTPTTQDIPITPTPATQEITETPEIPEPSETPAVSTSSPTAKNKTTCDVLTELANNSEPFDCVADTKEPCDHVNCTAEFLGLKLTAEVVLLPCNIPPAVLIVMSRDGQVVVNQTVDHSQEIIIQELFNLKLNVTLNHFQDSMGLQVDADIPLQPDPITIIKYTIIPIDKSNCDVPEDETQVHSHSKGMLESTPVTLTLIPLFCIATGMA